MFITSLKETIGTVKRLNLYMERIMSTGLLPYPIILGHNESDKFLLVITLDGELCLKIMVNIMTIIRLFDTYIEH
jgi:hypothetical protein